MKFSRSPLLGCLIATVTAVGCSQSMPADEGLGSESQAVTVVNPSTQTGENVAFAVGSDGSIVAHKPNPNDFFVSTMAGAHVLLTVKSTNGTSVAEPQLYKSTDKAVLFNTNLVALGAGPYWVDVAAYPEEAPDAWKQDPNWYGCDAASTCHTNAPAAYYLVGGWSSPPSLSGSCGAGSGNAAHMPLCAQNQDHPAGDYVYPFQCPKGSISTVDLHTTKCASAPCTALTVRGSSGIIYQANVGKTNSGPHDVVEVASMEPTGECIAEVVASSAAKFDIKAKQVQNVSVSKDASSFTNVFFPTFQWDLAPFAASAFDLGNVCGDIEIAGSFSAQESGIINPVVFLEPQQQSAYGLAIRDERTKFLNAIKIGNSGSAFTFSTFNSSIPNPLGVSVGFDANPPHPSCAGATGPVFSVSGPKQVVSAVDGVWSLSADLEVTVKFQYRVGAMQLAPAANYNNGAQSMKPFVVPAFILVGGTFVANQAANFKSFLDAFINSDIGEALKAAT